MTPDGPAPRKPRTHDLVLSIVVYAFAIWQALVGRWEVLVAVVAVYALTFAYFFHANRKARRARDEG
ncbi:MAG: hypothetical protein QOE53_2966 [Pseudonocardiales bacterium]|nr:hypothetical protein [Pseudonocardiales bacterium]